MPTVADLERLDALVKRLVPLADVQRGELIQAQQWNLVVGALIELARAVLGEEREGHVAAHGHPDQVTSGWLDPRLRTLVERGPLADPAGVARVAELERRLNRVSDRAEGWDEGLREARDRNAEIATRDLARQAEITAVRRTVEGLSDARDDVRALRETLTQLQADVGVAVEVGARLTVDGQPVDMQAISDKLKGLEELRERLRLPTGDLFDARALEIRFSELTNQFVTEEELDAAFEARLGTALENLRDQLMSAVDGRVSAATGTLRSDMLASVNQSLETFRGELNTRVSEVQASLSAQQVQAFTALRDQLISDLDGRVSAANQALRNELTGQLQQSAEGLRAELAAEVGGARRDFEAQLAQAVQQTSATFSQQLDSLRDDLVRRADEFAARLQADINNRLAEARRALDGALAEAMAAFRADFGAEVGKRFDEMSEAFKRMLEEALAEPRRSLEELWAQFAKLDERVTTIERRLFG